MKATDELFVPKGKDVFDFIKENKDPNSLKRSWIYIQKALVEHDKSFEDTELGNKRSDQRGIKLDSEKTSFYSLQEWIEVDYSRYKVDFPEVVIFVRTKAGGEE